jgi:hypothetical protein
MRYPPYETNPFEDVWVNAVSDTAQRMLNCPDFKKETIEASDLDEIEEMAREHVEEYFDIPPQWRDEVKEHEYDFIEDVITEAMSEIEIKQNDLNGEF